MTFTSFNGTAVNVTFGDGSNGTVKTLDQLNAAVLANNMTATLDSAGKLTISSTNDYASSILGSAAAGGAIGGTLTTAITLTTPSAPVVDASAQAVCRREFQMSSTAQNVVDRAAANGHDDILFTISVLARTVKLTWP